MEGKFQNKYRISSARAQWWNYGWNGAYFITICTRNKEYFFGKIKNDRMKYTPLGSIVYVLWHEIPYHCKNVELGDFVVMPNHIHGILIINKPQSSISQIHEDNVNTNVETGHALSPNALSPNTTQSPSFLPGQKRFQNIGKNTVSSILGSYKSAVSKYAGRMELPHGWQDLYYDHIIRDDAEYQRISDYIVSNPENWKDDKFNLHRVNQQKI